MKFYKGLLSATIVAGLVVPIMLPAAKNKPVKITPDVGAIKVKHGDEWITIVRNQNNQNTVKPSFAKTSRPCPPFCIQPSKLYPGVETIGEVELLGYVQKMSSGDDSIMLVDSRTADWVARGTIPGAVNIPWTALNPAKGASPIEISEILTEQFDVKEFGEGLYDFSDCKTLVMFCNGMWCGQSPNNIKNLVRVGYPPHKIKWYRGGMQAWEILGFNTAKPIE